MKVEELVGEDPKTNKRTVWIGWTHLKLLRTSSVSMERTPWAPQSQGPLENDEDVALLSFGPIGSKQIGRVGTTNSRAWRGPAVTSAASAKFNLTADQLSLLFLLLQVVPTTSLLLLLFCTDVRTRFSDGGACIPRWSMKPGDDTCARTGLRSLCVGYGPTDDALTRTSENRTSLIGEFGKLSLPCNQCRYIDRSNLTTSPTSVNRDHICTLLEFWFIILSPSRT